MSFLRSGITVGFFTLISRIFGYLRDITMASLMGTNIYADAFLVAFRLPNFFRTIFSEGAFSASFIPIYSSKTNNKESSSKFANSAFSFLLLILTIFIIVLYIFLPDIMKILAPGFSNDPIKLSKAILYAKITLPYLILVSLATCIGGILNSWGKFAAAAIMPIFLNMFLIIGLFFFAEKIADHGLIMSISVIVAGIFQLSFLCVNAYKNGLLPKLTKISLDQDIRSMFKNMLPIIFASGIIQLNLWVGTIMATHIDGAVASIYYAERLNQFPLAIIGTAIGTVLLPSITKLLASNLKEQANATYNQAILASLYLSIPCSIGLFTTSFPIINILFERNNFLREDTEVVSELLKILSIGLPAFVLNKILSPRFFAIKDTKTPVIISIFCLIINISLSITLPKYYSLYGIAYAQIIAAYFNIISLIYIQIKRDLLIIDMKITKKILKLIFLNLSFYFTLDLLSKRIIIFHDPSVKSLIILILTSLISYLLGTIIFDLYRLKEVKNIFRRK